MRRCVFSEECFFYQHSHSYGAKYGPKYGAKYGAKKSFSQTEKRPHIWN